MKEVYIYGCSGFAIELAANVQTQSKLVENPYKFLGYICDKEYVNEEFKQKYKYIGDDSVLNKGDSIILAIGENLSFKKELVKRLEARGILFPNFYHLSMLEYASVEYYDSLNIGKGNIFLYCSGINESIKNIGSFNIFQPYTGAAHDTVIGNYNVLSAYCNLMGKSSIGDNNILGVNSYLLPKASIGNNNKVAPGSFVYKRFRNNCVIAGNPATKVFENTSSKNI